MIQIFSSMSDKLSELVFVLNQSGFHVFNSSIVMRGKKKERKKKGDFFVQLDNEKLLCRHPSN